MTRKYKIVAKRDFGNGPGYWIKGRFVKSGWVVTDGVCNIMPGATWFLSVADAMSALRILINCGGDAKSFWLEMREERDAKDKEQQRLAAAFAGH